MVIEQPERRYDLVIIGGGMVGAGFACAVEGRPELGDLSVLVVEAGRSPAEAGGAGKAVGAAGAAGAADAAGAANKDSPEARQMLAQSGQSGFDARSTALSFGSSRILQGFGLWDGLRRHVTPIKEILVSDLGRFGSSRLSAEQQGMEALGYVVENQVLGRLLHHRLKESERLALVAPVRVSGIQPTAAGMRVTLQQGGGEGTDEAVSGSAAGNTAANTTETAAKPVVANAAADAADPAHQQWVVDAGLVVLADGGKSPVCGQLGIEQTRRDYAQQALIANIAFERPHRNIAFERFTETGPLAVLPLDDSDGRPRGSLVWTLAPQQADEYKSLPSSELLPLLQARFGHRLGRITHIGERFCYPLALTRAREQVRPGLVLLGNVAHTLHPVAGQGLNLALRDSEALVQTLAEARRGGPGMNATMGLGEMAVLQKYVERRAADQARTIRLTDGLVHLFSSTDPSRVLLRKFGLLAVDLLPAVRRRFALQAMGLN